MADDARHFAQSKEIKLHGINGPVQGMFAGIKD